ncbi:MAG: 3-dehydroquinate synthase [Ruminococcaceae bacterium]|nr:3-dehydroquinate synthase [Oscillospiraceae bacterium]
MTEIKINVPDSYKVYIGKGILKNCADILKDNNIDGKLVVVSDSNVAPLYLDVVINSLKEAGYDVSHFIFKAGEESKNINTLSDILEFFAESGLTRRDTVIALGGGVTGDMTGFAAGTYMRGISYVQIPTTLLACVDSSVGGKTAIDLKAGKNLAGLFIQPKAVICDTDTLSTLPDSVYSDGMAEVIKTAILSDKELFEALEKKAPRENDEYVIAKCVEYKGKIVAEDEFELGVRKLLNLGHTPAHSIEKLSKYTIPHGHAVGMGLCIMTRSACAEGLIDEELKDRIIALTERYGLSSKSPYSPKELADAAFYDKKRSGNTISVIKIRALGDCFTEKCGMDEIEGIFSRGNANGCKN